MNTITSLPWADIIPAVLTAIVTVLVKDHVIPPVWNSFVSKVAQHAANQEGK